MYYITKTMEIAGCHKLQLSYESKCEQLHGHNWIVTIYCKAKELNAEVAPAPQYLVDKHYLRKHGKNAYYGQK